MKFDLIKEYKNATSYKLLLLDYDGTLVGYTLNPEQALPSDRVIGLLQKLSADPSLKVIIITGREHHDIEKLVGNLSIDIIADHGAMIKENGKWRELITDNGLWKKKILPLMQELINERPDSFIEEKKHALTWHYRNLEPLGGYILSRDLIRSLATKVNSLELKIFDGNKVVEVVPEQIGKGNVIPYLLNKNRYDFIMAIGDDKTDEEMFKILMDNKNGITIKVGAGTSCAKYKLSSVNEVLTFLELLSF